MTRTERLENKGLSADEALKVVVFADQGLRWIKGTNGLNHQKRMDDFIDLIDTKPNAEVRELADYVRDMMNLSLYNCKPTDANLQAIVARCHYLRSLNLSGCVGITDEACTIMSKSCQALEHLILCMYH